MDSPASPATSSSAIVLASAANNHEVPSKSFEYYLKNREAGDLRIHWQRINQLGEIEQKWFDVHQDEICRQSKSLAVKVQSEHQKQHRLPQWRRRHAVSF
jgi:predicted DNA-binding WGR domain protein